MRVDKKEALRMLKGGATTQGVGDYFGVTHQAINLHRRKFIKEGKLPDKKAGKFSKSRSVGLEQALGEICEEHPYSLIYKLKELLRERGFCL